MIPNPASKALQIGGRTPILGRTMSAAEQPAPGGEVRRTRRGHGVRPLRVALLIESSRAFGRGMLDGLAECLRHEA